MSAQGDGDRCLYWRGIMKMERGGEGGNYEDGNALLTGSEKVSTM